MGDDDIEIRVTGDIEDIQAKFEYVKSGYKDLQGAVEEFAGEMNKLSKQDAKLFIDSLASMVAKSNEAKASMDGLASAVKGISSDTEFWHGFEADLRMVDADIKNASASARVFKQDYDSLKGAMQVQSSREFWQGFNQDLGMTAGQVNSAKASFEAFDKGGLVPVQGSMNTLRFATAGVSREIIVLAHEMVQGNFSRIPGSIMVLTERLGGLSLASLGVFAAIGVTAGVLGYFTYQAIAAAHAAESIKIGADIAGNFDLTTKAIDKTTKSVDAMRNVSTKDAREIVGEFAKMRGETQADLEAMSKASAELGLAQGTTGKEAASQLTAFLKEENVTLKELEDKFVGATRESLNSFIQIQLTGNAHEIAAAKMNLVADSLDREKDAAVLANSGMFASFHNFLTYVGALQSGFGIQETENLLIDENSKKWDENTKKLREAAAAKAATPLTHDEKLLEGDKLSDKLDPQRVHMDQLLHDISQLKNDLKEVEATETGAKLASDVAKYTAALKTAEGELAQLQAQRDKRQEAPQTVAGSKAIEEARVQISQIQADQDKSNSERLAAAEEVWNKLLESARGNSKQLSEVQIAANQSLRQFEIAVGNERIQDARLQISQIKADESKGAADRLAAITAVWARVLESDKLTHQQRLEAERDFNNAVGEELKRAQTVREQIARENINTDLQLRRISLQNARASDEAAVQMDQMTERQKLEHMKELALEEERLNLEMLQNEQKTYEADSAAFARVEDQKKILRAQTAAELARINQQMAQNDVKIQKDEIREERSKVNEIIGAEHQLVDGILGGRESAQTILLRMGGELIKKELENDLAYVTQRLLIREKGIIAEKGMEQGGYLVKFLLKKLDLGDTTATETAQTVAASTGETARTGATTAGETARTAEQTAAEVETQTMRSIANVAAVESYAAVAAAGAAAAMASIPYVGPALAAAAAAETFAMLQPYATMAALDVGAWEIPKTMPAMLHPGEIVMPKNFAQGYRENLQKGGGTAGSPLSGLHLNQSPAVHFEYSPTINAPERPTLPQLLDTHSTYMINWIHARLREGAIKVES